MTTVNISLNLQLDIEDENTDINSCISVALYK